MNRTPHPPANAPFFALVSVFLFALASQLSAQNATWNSANYTGNTWNANSLWNPADWPGATTGVVNLDVATFNNVGFLQVTLPSNLNVGGITFGTTGTERNPFLLTAGSLLPTAGGVIQTDSTFRGAATINTAVTAQGNLTLLTNGQSGSALVLSALSTAAESGSVVLTLDGSATSQYSYAGSILSGIVSQGTNSTLSLVKNGSGTWVLLGSNSYTGGTTLNGGMVITNSSTALGSTGSISVTSNTTVRLASSLNDISSRTILNDGATFTFDTNLTNTSWGSILTAAGSQTGGLTKAGLGQLTLVAANSSSVQTWRGATTVNAGLLFLDGNSTASGVTNQIDSNSRLVLRGGAIQLRGRTGQNNTQTFNGVTVDSGVSQILPSANAPTSYVVSLGSITRNTGGLLNVFTATGTRYQTSSSNTTGGLIKGVFIGSNDFASVNATGGLVGATLTTQNNAANWTGSSVTYTTGGAVSGTVGTGGTVDINGLRLSHGSSQSFAINGTLRTAGGIIFGSAIGNNTSEISGGNLTSTSGELLIVNNNNNQNLYGRNTISSTISDNGAATDVVFYNATANGTLFISGNNTYTGSTYVGGGANNGTGAAITLIGGASGARIGSSGATVFVNGGTGGSTNILRIGNADATGDVLGTIQLDNGRLSLNRTDAFTLSAQISGGAGSGFISHDNTGNATIQFAAGANSFQTLSQSAAGTLNLTGAGSVNTFFFGTANANYSFNSGSTTNFNSGSYYLPGAGNSGGNGIGTWNISGADVLIAGGRYFMSGGGVLNLNSGNLTFSGTGLNSEQQTSANVVFNINGGHFMTPTTSNSGPSGAAASFGVGTVAAATGSTVVSQTNGQVSVGLPQNFSLTTSSQSNLVVGAVASTHNSTYALSGGTLRVFGGISGGGTPSGGFSNNFDWTGGTLSTVSYNAANLTSSGMTGTLVQNGASAILAPGETFQGIQYTGRTTITGGYTINSGTVRIGIGGTTAATAFHQIGSGNFDNIVISGAATLAGNLTVNLLTGTNGSTFVPTASSSFVVMTYGSRTGTFSNSGGRVLLENDPFDGTLAINYNTANITLNGYEVNQWNGTTSTWGTPGGTAWTAGVEPNAPGKGAVFGSAGTANTTITLDSAKTVGQIVFSSANYSLGGGANLTLDNNGSSALVTFQDSGSRAITAPIVLASDLIIVGNSTGSLTLGPVSGSGRTLAANVSGMSVTLSGNNSYGSTFLGSGVTLNVGTGSTAGTLGTAAITNNGTLVFNRSDSDLNITAGISGVGNLTQAGSGSTTLSGANSYTGTTRINSGTLRLSGSGTLGANASVLGQISSGAVLDLNGTSQTIASFSGNSTGGAIQNNSGAGTSVLSVGGAGNTQFDGRIQNNNGTATGGRVGLFIGGTSNLTLAANNTFSGGTTVGTGATLTIGTTSTISSGAIQGGATGTGNVTLQGGATVRNTSSTNSWFVDTMAVQGDVTLASNQRLSVTYRTMDLTGGERVFNVTGRSTSVTSGNTAVETTGNGQWEMSSSTLLGTPVVRDGVMNLQTTFTGTNYGTMRFNNVTTFDNASIVVGSNVLLLVANNLGTNATNSAAIDVRAGGILNLAAGSRLMRSLAGEGNVFGSMNATNVTNVTLTLNGASGSSDFGGVLSNGPGNGSLSLSKTGASTQVLSGANTFNGTTSVSGGGVLRLASADALGSTSGVTVTSNATLDITVSNAVNDAATVSLGGGTIAKGAGLINETFGALTLTANSTVNFGSGTGSFTFASYTPGSFVLKFENFDIGNSLTVTTGTFNAGAFDFNGFGYSWAEAPVGGFTITAIPEPSAVAAALAFLGLAGMKVVRRRRKAAAETDAKV